MNAELFATCPNGCAHQLVPLGKAAPRIGAAVGAGSPPRCTNLPKDVKAIQEALNRFAPQYGGPQPKLDVDGKCGPLTRAAILRFQQVCGFPVQDGIVDVNGHTIRRLREGQPGPVAPPVLLEQYRARIIEVLGAAQALVDLARDHLSGLDPLGAGKAAYEKVDRQFHLRLTNDPAGRLEKIRGTFQTMQSAIGYVPMGVVLAVDEPLSEAAGAFMYAYAGGFHRRADLDRYSGDGRFDTASIYLCPAAQALVGDAFVYVFIHELAHYSGPKHPIITDVAYFKKNPERFRWLGPDQAYWNADSYAQLAFAAVGRPDWAP